MKGKSDVSVLEGYFSEADLRTQILLGNDITFCHSGSKVLSKVCLWSSRCL